MRTFTGTLLLLLVSLSLFSQGRPGRGGGQGMSNGRFYGRIVDEKSDKGIDAASVQLIGSTLDSVNRTRLDSMISGMLTRKSGDFSLENLPVMGRYRLLVSAIGYKSIEQPVSFNINFIPGQDMSQAMSALDKDLGNIKLAIDTQMLASVTVSAEKPMMQMGIDRKIFNVDKNINSTGGTAVDIMRNIPGLNVDIDGNVSMRNSAPQIFVDGRPTTLSLEQIPSDAIESVEMITNPSAKFDASGGQSGILNIVLKKARKVGYNGGIRAGVDSRGRFNGGGDFNIRQGKINIFANAFYNQRKSKSTGETNRIDITDDPETSSFQSNSNVSTGTFAFARFGIDYFINNRNTITISQNIMGGKFKMDNQNDLLYEAINSPDVESQYRNTLGQNKFNNYTSSIGYKHLFPQTGRELTADVNYNYSPNSGYQNISIRSFNDMNQVNPKTPEQFQNISTGGNNKFVVMQTDYVHPLNANMKWEAGLRAQIRRFESHQFNFYNGIPQTSIDNQFAYTDNVYAAYGTFSHKVKDAFSYQLGLRMESSSYNGDQAGKQSYKNDFPVSLFPSVFLTKSIGGRQDIQLNYSRRINRPNFFQLMPNTDFSDTLNLSTGNPDLKPEFTNSLEMSYQKIYGERNNTFLVTLFGKHTENLIARYQSLRAIGDTVALVSSYINANNAYAAGVEFIFKNNLTSWWELNFNTNVYYSKINGSDVVANLENVRTSSFSKINNTFKLTKTLSLQLSGEYQSKSALPVSTSNSGGGGGGRGGGGDWRGGPPSSTQGFIDANYGVDIGIRKEFRIKKNQATLSLNMNDVLRTRKYSAHSESDVFIQDEWRRRDAQIVRLNFSYRFGKFDVSLFKRKNTRSETDDVQGVMQ
ncbi:MAG TPA: outer membrane beta-barrel protein [Flavitalea sp.]|nr:outer membrane beta-barrel protein [Flavitalea sp.]